MIAQIKRRVRMLVDRYYYGETCPYYYGTGTCDGNRGCGAYGEPVCITSSYRDDQCPWWRR